MLTQMHQPLAIKTDARRYTVKTPNQTDIAKHSSLFVTASNTIDMTDSSVEKKKQSPNRKDSSMSALMSMVEASVKDDDTSIASSKALD